MKKLALLALALPLLGNAPADQVSKARAILSDKLVDFDHARVRDMRVVEHVMEPARAVLYGTPAGTKTVAVCGDVNAPNHMGGMTGWRETAIILQGRNGRPLAMVGPDGVSDLGEVTAFCGYPKDMPPADPELTAGLQPSAPAP